jgi:hypothetical protein
LCNTEIAQEVRGGVLNQDLWFNVFVSVLPFLAVLLAAVLIHGRRSGEGRQG